LRRAGRGSPQYISLSIASLGEIVVEGGHRRIVDFVGNDPPVSGETDAVGQLDSAMMSHEKGVVEVYHDSFLAPSNRAQNGGFAVISSVARRSHWVRKRGRLWRAN
jgi:hypothetical protein